jgi:hypothetical protein
VIHLQTGAEIRRKATIALALNYATQHRNIHIQWLNYWLANTTENEEKRSAMRYAGGPEHQQASIDRYDVILSALNRGRKS